MVVAFPPIRGFLGKINPRFFGFFFGVCVCVCVCVCVLLSTGAGGLSRDN